MHYILFLNALFRKMYKLQELVSHGKLVVLLKSNCLARISLTFFVQGYDGILDMRWIHMMSHFLQTFLIDFLPKRLENILPAFSKLVPFLLSCNYYRVILVCSCKYYIGV